MARPQTVHGLKPDATVRANAQKIVATRTAEVFSFAPYLANPAYVTQLHDMRIAAKRLRYALEIFAPALDPEAAAALATVKEFQEIVGEIHDDDVLMDITKAHLGTRATEAAQALGSLATAADESESVDAFKVRSRAFVTDEDWVREQVALAAMIVRTARDRHARFTHLVTKWEEWRASGLREQLEALAIDLPADVIAAPHAERRQKATTAAHLGEDAPTVAPGLAPPQSADRAKESPKNGHRRGLIRGALRRTPKGRS